eukprot:gnl/Ergobibamus_cyprinoides/210.p1 GENE.gnl/Ergobibamus_cyprinoides/210~~gnl/Ergobibamus_cyprinoides/210.p1  ORF type:complete len:298 (+),score=146.74 gnl/Ergobibamus_cyprinoides/210:428-1321(+)
MGRSASHIALECALQTHANACLIGEEVEAKNMTLQQIVAELADVVCARAAVGKNFGVVLVPEGLIEFIPEFNKLMTAISTTMAHAQGEVTPETIRVALQDQPEMLAAFEFMPLSIQQQLLLERDPHGNIQVSRIETEKFLATLVEAELVARKEKGLYAGKFSAQCHFYGYSGRCAMPSQFDSHYCYALGATAAVLIASRKTGYMSCVANVAQPLEQWTPSGLPLPSMMQMELRHGEMKPVIRKALVELEGPVFREFAAHRAAWAMEDAYVNPGPIQFYGPAADRPTMTLQLESGLSA